MNIVYATICIFGPYVDPDRLTFKPGKTADNHMKSEGIQKSETIPFFSQSP